VDETRKTLPKFESFPLLETERLLLREIVPEDAPALFEFRSDPEVQRYNGGPMTDLQQATDLIQELADGYQAQKMILWGVTLKDSDEGVIGLFGLSNWSHDARQAEIGYCLKRTHWRQGLALEALKAIMAFGFHEMDLNRIHACPWAENVASVRLLEKLGFVREGTRRDEYFEYGAFHDEALYAILRREYEGRSEGFTAAAK
jgi:ribosomal-protein-alanine N-acetyltransferase